MVSVILGIKFADQFKSTRAVSNERQRELGTRFAAGNSPVYVNGILIMAQSQVITLKLNNHIVVLADNIGFFAPREHFLQLSGAKVK
jgi:hypothetical protein